MTFQTQTPALHQMSISRNRLWGVNQESVRDRDSTHTRNLRRQYAKSECLVRVGARPA